MEMLLRLNGNKGDAHIRENGHHPCCAGGVSIKWKTAIMFNMQLHGRASTTLASVQTSRQQHAMQVPYYIWDQKKGP